MSSYKPDKGVRLATYASRCIENEVLMYFRASKKSAQDVSLSETIETDGSGSDLCLMDVVTFEDDILEQISRGELSRTLRGLVADTLDPRECEIITLRYGLDGRPPKTQHEVAKQCGISRSYVSQLDYCKNSLRWWMSETEEKRNPLAACALHSLNFACRLRGISICGCVICQKTSKKWRARKIRLVKRKKI